MPSWGESVKARIVLIALLMGLIMLSGCSNYSASHEYYKARPEAKLEIPPGLDRPIEKQDMALPESSTRSATYSNYSGDCKQDPAVLHMVSLQHLEIKREGNFVWLHANANPDQLWGPSREFLEQKGFSLSMDDDDLGLLETAWFEYQEDGQTLRDKYRLRFEFGKAPGSSEIYLSLRSEALLENQWQAREVDPELEIEMLKRLARHLGSEEVAFSEIQTADTEVSLHQRGKEGGLSLVINHDFAETWRRVIKAIEENGDFVEERSVNQRYLIARFEDKSDAAKARKNSWMGSVLTPSEKHAVGRFRIEFFNLQSATTEIQIQDLQGRVTLSKRAKKVMESLEQTLAEQ